MYLNMHTISPGLSSTSIALGAHPRALTVLVVFFSLSFFFGRSFKSSHHNCESMRGALPVIMYELVLRYLKILEQTAL